MAGGDAAKAERIFEGYMQGEANRLERMEKEKGSGLFDGKSK